MRTRLAFLIGAAGLAAALSYGCDKSDTPTAPAGGKPELTPSSGGTPTQLGRQSGWRTETGPVLIQVLTGTLTFYSADDPTCSPIVLTAGEGWFSSGEYAHLVRNETNEGAETLLTAFVPPDAEIRVDADQPENCPSF